MTLFDGRHRKEAERRRKAWAQQKAQDDMKRTQSAWTQRAQLQTTQQQFPTYGSIFAASSTPSIPYDFMSGRPQVEDGGMSIEPIVSWRHWIVTEVETKWYLRSASSYTLWPYRRELMATCGGYLTSHESPDLTWKCTNCGIYSLTKQGLDAFFHNGDMGITGEIYIWGNIVVCQLGYRSEFAYPKNLKIDYDTKNAHRAGAALAESYGIPVSVAGRTYQPKEVPIED